MTEQAILRIQQLAEQADNFTIEKFGTSLNLPDPKEWQKLRDVKFAELIAKECVDVLEHDSDKLDVTNEFDYCWLQGVKHAIDLLTKHFGVKQ